MKTLEKRRLAPGLNIYAFGLVVVLLFMGVIWGAQALGMWSSSGRYSPSGTPVNITGKDPAEIKGWMKLEDVVTGYNVSLDELLAAFKLPPATPGSAAIKDLEGQSQNFSVTTLRNWLAQRTGATYTPQSATPKSGKNGSPDLMPTP
ncbi:MAG TPA: hypothetical protein VH186_08300 [Chloroflexia bacterium]|nr:hypothetical protein [Chloroflexia bacterium]